MEHEINLQYIVNGLANQLSQLSKEKAYHEAIITTQQEEIERLRKDKEEAE